MHTFRRIYFQDLDFEGMARRGSLKLVLLDRRVMSLGDIGGACVNFSSGEKGVDIAICREESSADDSPEPSNILGVIIRVNQNHC